MNSRLEWFDIDVQQLTDDQVDRARRYVAGKATDADDCRDLLDLLGIGPGQAQENSR